MPGTTKPVDLSHLPPWHQRFCRELRRQRKAQGLTGEQLAENLGVYSLAVTRWERGVRTPSISQVLAIAQELGTDFADLTGIGLDE